MPFYAHSANKYKQKQLYSDHIINVTNLAINNAKNVSKYSKYGQELITVVALAAWFHDLGKMADEYQQLFDGKKIETHNHVDAGVKRLLDLYYEHHKLPYLMASIIVLSHHYPIPNLSKSALSYPFNAKRIELNFEQRARDINKQEEAINNTNQYIDTWLERHEESVGSLENFLHNYNINIDSFNSDCFKDPLFYRIALSCLVDGDHYDTGKHFNPDEIHFDHNVELKPQERLMSLNKYIDGLSNNAVKHNKRHKMRQTFYKDVSNTCISDIALCNGAVGIGKTTASLGAALLTAKEYELRRLIVVNPYIALINQSTNVYNKTLILEGENPDTVITPDHYMVDWSSDSCKLYTTLWHAPVINTTYIRFWETLASARPSVLRKLHNVPGSIIIVDEYDRMPMEWYSLMYEFMSRLVENWGCKILLSSGTPTEFWKFKSFQQKIQLAHQESNKPEPSTINTLNKKAQIRIIKSSVSNEYEQVRVKHERIPQAMEYTDLCTKVVDRVDKLNGPALVICNTVKNAAIIAKHLKYNLNQNVEHLSTSLTPKDRKNIEQRVIQKLKSNCKFILVGTSCVECGMDFDFRVGFREMCSYNSMIQTGGRVNREGRFTDAVVYSFKLTGKHISENNAFSAGIKALDALFDEGIDPTGGSATKSLEKIYNKSGQNTSNKWKEWTKKELKLQFEYINKNAKIIKENTYIVIIDKDIADKITNNIFIPYKHIISNSVQIYSDNIDKYKCKIITNQDSSKDNKSKVVLCQWTLGYDSFLGYMKGVFDMEESDL